MEITISKEDLSQIDCGGAYREVEARVIVDNTLTPIKQKQSLIYEVLEIYLDPLEFNGEQMDEIAHKIAEALEQFDQLEN